MPTQLGKHFFPNFSSVYGLPIDYLSPTLYLTDILIIFIFIFSFTKILKLIFRKYIFKFFLLLVFILFLLISVSVSKNPMAGLFGILKFIEFSYLGVFIYFNLKQINKKTIAYILSVGIISESLLALAQYSNQGSLQGLFYFFGERSFNGQTLGIANVSINGALVLRPYGTFPHPNVLAGFLDIAMIIFLSFRKNISKYFIFIVLCIGTIGIIISFSRSATLAWFLFVISFFALSIVEKYKKTKLNPRVFSYKNSFLIILTTLVLSIFFISIFGQRFTSIKLTDESIVQRESLINQSVVMISKDPIFGVGINNFINNLNPSFNTSLLLQPVHNIFLLTFSQTGLIGLGLLLLIFFKGIINSIRPRISIYKLGLILSVIFIGILDHYFFTIQQGQLLFTLVFSFAIFREK